MKDKFRSFSIILINLNCLLHALKSMCKKMYQTKDTLTLYFYNNIMINSLSYKHLKVIYGVQIRLESINNFSIKGQFFI